MVEQNITKEQAISMLKWSIEVGADEALNETTGYRLSDKSPNNKTISDIGVKDAILSDGESRSHPEQLMKSNVQVIDKELVAIALAKECRLVDDIGCRIKEFPHFRLQNGKNDASFYNGSAEASVIMFLEPEIYSSQGDNEGTSGAKWLLFDRIFDSIDTLLSDEALGTCGSIVTFPEYFDSSEEAKDYNFQLIRPFLFRYVELIKPHAIILMDGFLKDWLFKKNDVNEDINFAKSVEIVTFPSLDVLLTAPQRKKEVWNTILDLKTKLKKRRMKK